MKNSSPMITAVILCASMCSSVQAGVSFGIEGGFASNGYNEVRIPGNAGSDISLTDDLMATRSGYWRLRLGVDLGSRHRLSLLVAPLRVKASGMVDRIIDFNGARFEAGTALNSRYRFDSYRLTYSYALVQSGRFDFEVGVTAKIRDAGIRVESSDQSSEKTNTGFVPLVNFGLDWSFNSVFGLLVEGDALAAPQGRAEDVLLALYADASEGLRLRLGYRILEGGVDNDEVYNFTLVHFLSTGVTWSF